MSPYTIPEDHVPDWLRNLARSGDEPVPRIDYRIKGGPGDLSEYRLEVQHDWVSVLSQRIVEQIEAKQREFVVDVVRALGYHVIPLRPAQGEISQLHQAENQALRARVAQLNAHRDELLELLDRNQRKAGADIDVFFLQRKAVLFSIDATLENLAPGGLGRMAWSPSDVEGMLLALRELLDPPEKAGE